MQSLLSSSAATSKKKFSNPSSTNNRKRPLSTAFPDHNDQLYPESSILSYLSSLERRLDGSINQRFAEIQELLQTNSTHSPSLTPSFHRFRVHIWSEFVNGHWTLSLVGLPAPDSEQGKQRQFLHYLRSIIIELDPRHYPGATGVGQWDKQLTPGLTDGIQIRRIGSKEVDCQARILLQPDYSNEVFQGNSQICRLLDFDFLATFPQWFYRLFNLLKSRSLQSQQDLNLFHLNKDKQIAELFGEAPLTLSSIAYSLRSFLRPPDPIIFSCWFSRSNQQNTGFTYEILLPSPLDRLPLRSAPLLQPGAAQLLGIPANPLVNKEVTALDSVLEDLSAHYQQSKRRFQFLDSFSRSPVTAVRRLIASASGEFHHSANVPPSSVNGFIDEALRHSQTVSKPEWLFDAVDRLIEESQNTITNQSTNGTEGKG
jgi:hypothetical protein